MREKLRTIIFLDWFWVLKERNIGIREKLSVEEMEGLDMLFGTIFIIYIYIKRYFGFFTIFEIFIWFGMQTLIFQDSVEK